MKKKKLKVVYKSLWDTATDEQKKEYKIKNDQAYDILFSEVLITKLKSKN